jgi:hypothetical protein
MISRSFIIQAFIALVILAASLTSSVNATAIARQFLFFGFIVREGLLLTSDLGLSSQGDDARAALSAPISTADNEKRFRKFHFLALADREEVANFEPSVFPRGPCFGGRIVPFAAGLCVDRRSLRLCLVEVLCVSSADGPRLLRRPLL